MSLRCVPCGAYRYYTHPELGIKITYLQMFGAHAGLKGHNISWLEGKGMGEWGTECDYYRG
jgi:hypothetical protein